MRLWSLHPKYLDAKGLCALWREALLARAVLRGETVGYRHHPQLERFRDCRAPRAAINAYLAAVHEEATARGYRFDRRKLGRAAAIPRIATTRGQLAYEWSRLREKLRARDRETYRRLQDVAFPEAHPLFDVVRGPVCTWERPAARRRAKGGDE